LVKVTLFYFLVGPCDMNAWEPSTLRNLSSNYTVIVFDNRGVGNTTTGTKPYSIQQLANDTSDLLDALKIQKTLVASALADAFNFERHIYYLLRYQNSLDASSQYQLILLLLITCKSLSSFCF
jgi:alpha/beta hydrolase family protein